MSAYCQNDIFNVRYVKNRKKEEKLMVSQFKRKQNTN